MTIAQLVLALVGVFWGVDFSAVVAVIGILAVVLSHPELLRLFFYLESASFIVTFLRLSLRWRQTWGIVAFALLLEVVLQGVAAWYAYSLLNDAGGGDSYAAFGGDGHGGRSDPFQSYEPPASNSSYQGGEQQQPQQQQPQQQQSQQQQPPNLV